MKSLSFNSSKNSLSKFMKSLCTPAYIYFILAVISTIIYIYTMLLSSSKNPDAGGNHYTFFGLICKISWHFLFLLFLDYLCRKGHKTIAWVVLFLPFILMIMIMILLMFTFSFISATDETLKNLKYEIKDDINSKEADSHNYNGDGRPSITPDGMLIEGYGNAGSTWFSRLFGRGQEYVSERNARAAVGRESRVITGGSQNDPYRSANRESRVITGGSQNDPYRSANREARVVAMERDP